MSAIKAIKIGNSNFFKADDVKAIDPTFFVGTSRTVRRIIELKKIQPSQYIFATHSKSMGWKPSSDQARPSSNASLLLLDEWVVANVPNMKVNTVRKQTNENNDDHAEAPPLLELSDDEKFRDSDGNIFEIETRGERTAKNIFFLAKDVSRVFDIPSLVQNILNESSNSTCVIDKHYKIFFTEQKYSVENNGQTIPTKNVYLTYKGVLKILFGSRSKRAEYFTDWATDVLFVVQMGTEEQREELGAKMIGQPARSVRAVFKTFATDVPCIYRFALGTVATLRTTMNLPMSIPDNFVIIKYGLTSDLDRRTGEHIRTYEKIDGVRLGLIDFGYIDPKFLSQAECDLHDFFRTIETPIVYEKFSELVAIDPAHEKQIKKQFTFIATAYAGSLTDLILQIEKLKMEIKMLTDRHTYELRDKDHIIIQKNLEIEKKEIQLQNKDFQIRLLEIKSNPSLATQLVGY
jgi:hypothetical protein